MKKTLGNNFPSTTQLKVQCTRGKIETRQKGKFLNYHVGTQPNSYTLSPNTAENPQCMLFKTVNLLAKYGLTWDLCNVFTCLSKCALEIRMHWLQGAPSDDQYGDITLLTAETFVLKICLIKKAFG